MRDCSFAKEERLKKNNQINRVFDKGIAFRVRSINIYLLKRENGSTINRAAFIIKKNLYNKKIVLRNRFKRVLREAYRSVRHLLPGGYDIVILARNIKKHTSAVDLEKEIADVFKKRIKK